MLRVVILGYGPLGLALTRGVLTCENNAELVGVFPWSQQFASHHLIREKPEQEFRQFIRQQALPLVKASSVNGYDFVQQLTRLKPDIVLVGSWGEIIKPYVLQLAGVSFINCHPSLLPLHRGPNPYTAAILAGDNSSGITFHLMDTGIDTGPILLQASLILDPLETGLSLRQRCSALAEAQVGLLLEQLGNQTLVPIPQSQPGSYDKITWDTGWICWSDSPAIMAQKMRALYPWLDNLARLGKYTIAFSQGELVTNTLTPQEAIPVGTIISQSSGHITVAILDPSQHLYLKAPRFVGYTAFASWFLAKILLRPGKQLTSPG